jgi:hypothetical protein
VFLHALTISKQIKYSSIPKIEIFLMITDAAEGAATNMVAGKHWHL